MNRFRRDRGVALLTVLLLLAVMSVLVIGVLDDIRFGLRRAGNAQLVGQAQWYALGAESLAATRIGDLQRRDGGRITLQGNWNGHPFVFPIDDAGGADGVVNARIDDGTTCFNLNSVVEGAGEQWQRREEGARQFRALLRALGIAPARANALSDVLVDWIDSDQDRSDAGAEDADYLALSQPYRTPGTLLSEPSELRALSGFDPATYARLRPHVCALPDARLSPININTLEPHEALLLSMLTDNALDPGTARRIIASRPAAGWRDIPAFWQQPLLQAMAPAFEVPEQLAVRTAFFHLQAEVQYGEAQVALSSLFELDAGGRVRLLARRWTPEE